MPAVPKPVPDFTRLVIRIDIPSIAPEFVIELRARIREALKEYPTALLDLALLPPLSR